MSISAFGSGVNEPETEYYPCDGFNRIVAATTPTGDESYAWGQASGGWYWTVRDGNYGYGQYASVGVDGQYGYIKTSSPYPDDGYKYSAIFAYLTNDNFGWVYENPVTISVRFKFTSVGSATFGFGIGFINQGTGVTINGGSYSANTWYIAKIYLDEGVQLKRKVWIDGNAEPDWQYTSSITSSLTNGYFHDVIILVNVFGNTTNSPTADASNAVTVYFDYLRFDICDPAWEGSAGG